MRLLNLTEQLAALSHGMALQDELMLKTLRQLDVEPFYVASEVITKMEFLHRLLHQKCPKISL